MTRPNNSATAALLRGLALAAWTWIVFAAFGASALIAGRELPNTELPSGFNEAFVAVLTFEFGVSSYYGRPALSIVIKRLGPTLILLSGAVVIAAVVGGGTVTFARQTDGGRRLVTLLGYALGFPAAAWLLASTVVSSNTVPLFAREAPVDVIGFLAGSGALALPLIAAVARATVRDTNDRMWLIDGRLFVSWLLSAIVIVESLLGIRGVGGLLYEALAVQDRPVLIAAAAVLTVPALVTVVAYEILWSNSDTALSSPTATYSPDRSAALTDVMLVGRENTHIRLGLVGVGVLVVGGVVGVLLPSPPAQPLAIPRVLVGVLIPLFNGLVVALIAGVVGILLGWLTQRVPYGRTISTGLTGYAATIPLLLWFLALRPPSVPGEAFGIVAIAPLVGRRVARDLDQAGNLSLGVILPAFGVALVGAGVVTLVGLHLPTLGATPVRWPVIIEQRLGASTLALMFAGLPSLLMFLLGEGFRQI